MEKEKSEELKIEEREIVEETNQVVSETERKKLDEYEQQVSVGKSKKKKVWSLLFFLLNVGIVVGIILYQVFTMEDFTPINEIAFNLWWLLALVALFFIIMFLDCIPVAYLVKKACGRSRFKLAYKTTILGRYYDSVTPMAAGGQPFQVTYLMSYDVPSTSSLSIPIAKLFFIQLTWFVISFVCLIFSFSNSSYNSFVSIASYVGFICNFAILFVNFFLAISKNFGKKIVVKVLKFLQKIKIVKDYEKQYKKTTAYIEDYQNIMIQYMKSPKDFIVMFFSVGVREVLVYTLPFFIYLTFGCPNGYHADLFSEFLIMGVLIELAASFIPLPGGSGVSELSFSAMFAMHFGGGVVWAMLTYRFLTYYMDLVLGLMVMTYDILYGKRKYRWVKKQRALQAESRAFKQIQIQNFRSERASRRKKQLQKVD